MVESARVAAASLLDAGSGVGELQDRGKSLDEMLFWIDGLGAAVFVLDQHSLAIRHANQSAAEFFMVDSADLAGACAGTIIGGDADLMLAQIWCTSPPGVVGDPFLVRGRFGDQDRMLMVRATRVIVEGESLRLFTFTDAPVEGALTTSGWQNSIIEIMNWLPVGFEIANSEQRTQFSNAHFFQLFGWKPHEICDVADWWRLAYPDPADRRHAQWKWESEINAARDENREMTPFDLDVATASGERRRIQFHHRTIGDFYVNLYLDVTRERAYERELRLLAETDPLTGVMNRRRFFDEAAKRFEADERMPLSLLMLDIDHFKDVNDTHGHIGGDTVLKEFTERCADVLRNTDALARLGGEEFAVLLSGATLDAARKVSERLCAAVSEKAFSLANGDHGVTTSIGGTCRATGDTVDSMLSRADKALYRAKRAGRNRVVLMAK